MGITELTRKEKDGCRMYHLLSSKIRQLRKNPTIINIKRIEIYKELRGKYTKYNTIYLRKYKNRGKK